MSVSPFDDISSTLAYEGCIATVLSKPPLPPGSKFCPRTFDGWGCWSDTPANTTAFIPCPTVVPGFLSHRRAFKVCLEDGTWFRHPETNKPWSNYTTCVDQEDLGFRQVINNLYISGYSISVVALLVSLALFFSFSSLNCDRIRIHKNLFLSFVVNNTMWIFWYTLVIFRADVLISNGVYCQVLHVLVNYFMVCNYFWMFCEGLYLHTLLVVAFLSEKKMMRWLYLIGWGVPILPTSLYAWLRGSSPADTVLCWIEDSKYLWILNGPVCFSMLLNAFFLINIVRVLVTKLRAFNSPEAHHTRKAVRATLILIPLLGLQYLLTPFRPPAGSKGEQIYETLAAVFTSFQGLCVSLLFCFCNAEVTAAVKKFCTHQLLSDSAGGRSATRRTINSTVV